MPARGRTQDGPTGAERGRGRRPSPSAWRQTAAARDTGPRADGTTYDVLARAPHGRSPNVTRTRKVPGACTRGHQPLLSRPRSVCFSRDTRHDPGSRPADAPQARITHPSPVRTFRTSHRRGRIRARVFFFSKRPFGPTDHVPGEKLRQRPTIKVTSV